jgi:hypothetical protein
MTLDAILHGAETGEPPDDSKWIVTREKTTGFAPGFTARDAKGETWFVSFDPPSSPEGATGAIAVATKIFWALGYNQVDNRLATVRSCKSIRPQRSSGPTVRARR